MDELEMFDHFLTTQNLALSAGTRQRLWQPPPGDVNEQPLASLRRMLGQDALDRIFTGITDPDDSDTDDSEADAPRDIDPGFFRLPGGRTVRLPGGGDPGWSVKEPGRIDRGKLIDDGVAWIRPGTDRGKLIDNGVYRVPIRIDPSKLAPGAHVDFLDLLRAQRPPLDSIARLAADRPEFRGSPGSQPGPAMIPEAAPAATARAANPSASRSAATTTYRSPASGLRSPSQPPGAGVSSETRSKPSSESPERLKDGSPADRAPINVLPTAALIEKLLSGAAEQMTSLAESASETSIDHLRQEIFSSQTARNSLLPH